MGSHSQYLSFCRKGQFTPVMDSHQGPFTHLPWMILDMKSLCYWRHTEVLNSSNHLLKLLSGCKASPEEPHYLPSEVEPPCLDWGLVSMSTFTQSFLYSMFLYVWKKQPEFNTLLQSGPTPWHQIVRGFTPVSFIAKHTQPILHRQLWGH